MSGNESTRHRLAGLILWIVGLCMATQIWAQPSKVLAPRRAQFVFVIDDSGSMGQFQYGETDPDRLAVFAVRALLGVLDDGDWATVVRLNGPADGETPLALAPLDTRQRQSIDQILDLGGKLASYNGKKTPCRRALQRVVELLDRADRPDMSQVVLFLSDGECTPSSEERVLDLFAGLRSMEQDERFQFYLLRFQGTNPSPELARLASQSRGRAIEVRRGDPTRILNTFAQALSRSQGYESQILRPEAPLLPAHRGAGRIRLLAVADGGGDPLQIRVSARNGTPLPMREIDRGVHHYEQGKKYRYASAEYRPTGQEVEVEVLGAGSGWELVALPEYRLSVSFLLRRGECGEGGNPVDGNVLSAGADYCAEIRLLNDRSQPVGQDVTREGTLAGVVEVETPGRDAVALTANPTHADVSAFQLDLPALEEGPHTLQASVQLKAPGEDEARVLRAPARTVQAADRSITPEPLKMDFGLVFPGFRGTQRVVFRGSFEASDAYLVPTDSVELPECITLSFADRPLGERFRVQPNQGYLLKLEVGEQCPAEKVRLVSGELMLERPQGASGVAIPFQWQLDTTVLKGEPVLFDLHAGSKKRGRVAAAQGDSAKRFRAMLSLPTDEHGESAGDLRVGFATSGGPEPWSTDENGNPLLEKELSLGAGEQPLELLAWAGACCKTGTYRSRLSLQPVTGGQAQALPIELKVQGDWWTCYRSWVIAGLLGFLIALVVFYILSMFSHSTFLSKEQLISRLVPLRWPRYGGAPQPSKDRSGDREEVEDIVGLGLAWHRRVLNWLRSNPLVFGLPGKRYRETAELFLTHDMASSSVVLVPERDVIERLRKAEEIDPWEEGRLFAYGSGGVAFHSVRGPKGEIGQLTPDGWFGKTKDFKVQQMRKGQRLVRKLPERDRREGAVAGWELG